MVTTSAVSAGETEAGDLWDSLDTQPSEICKSQVPVKDIV